MCLRHQKRQALSCKIILFLCCFIYCLMNYTCVRKNFWVTIRSWSFIHSLNQVHPITALSNPHNFSPGLCLTSPIVSLAAFLHMKGDELHEISIWHYFPGARLLSFVLLEPSFSTLPSSPIDSLPSGFLLGLACEGRWEAGSMRWPTYLPNSFPGGHQTLVASLNWCSQLITAFTQSLLLSFKNCSSSHPSRSKNGNRLPCDFPTPCPHLWT